MIENSCIELLICKFLFFYYFIFFGNGQNGNNEVHKKKKEIKKTPFLIGKEGQKGIIELYQ